MSSRVIETYEAAIGFRTEDVAPTRQGASDRLAPRGTPERDSERVAVMMLLPRELIAHPSDAQVFTFLRHVYPVIILNTIAVGMMWPALPAMLLDVLQNDVASVAFFLAKVNGINAILDFFANPLLGALSDLVGRRVLLLQSLGMAAACNIIVAVYASPGAILLAKVLFGLCNVTKAMCYAMLVDVLSACNASRAVRVRAFGLMGMAIGSGFAIGPLIGGVLGLTSPVTTALCASFIMAATAILVRRRFRWYEMHASSRYSLFDLLFLLDCPPNARSCKRRALRAHSQGCNQVEGDAPSDVQIQRKSPEQHPPRAGVRHF